MRLVGLEVILSLSLTLAPLAVEASNRKIVLAAPAARAAKPATMTGARTFFPELAAKRLQVTRDRRTEPQRVCP